MSEAEFIAADLTLYSNPVNRALGNLHRPAPSAPSAASNKKDKDGKAENKKEEEDDDDKEIIAADLTTYDSPMGQLERTERERERNQEEAIKRVAAKKEEQGSK